MSDLSRSGCPCCGAAPLTDGTPWQGRLDAYCLDCAHARCDAYPGDCGKRDEPKGTCALCGQTVLARNLMKHLADAHNMHDDVQRWPDGSPVVIDKTLEAIDFELRQEPPAPDDT